jgi:DNA-directed RNA polymerase subunit K/omega
MDFKKSKASRTTQTREFKDIEQGSENIYQSIMAVAKRSNDISQVIREELLSKIDEFKTNNENLEEIFENNEQIEVSKFYESLPKPVLIALDEMLKGKLKVEFKEEEEQETEKE